MREQLQSRIECNGWYWEVYTHDREVVARGIAETHAQARADIERVTVADQERPALTAAGSAH